MIDFDIILLPIPGDDPGGTDLRYDPVYDRIKELRREDDPRASRGIWTTRLKSADWVAAADICADVLARRSKDLQLACWLVDALVARDGIDALPAGFGFLGAFCDTFWKILWPRPLPDDEEDARQLVFSWLDQRVSEWVMGVAIARQATQTATWQDYVYAQRTAHSADRKTARNADDQQQELDLAAIEVIVEATADEHFYITAKSVAASEDALERFKAGLSPHCGGHGPSFSHTIAVLRAVSTFLHPHLLRRGIDLAPTPLPPSAVEDTATMPDTNMYVTTTEVLPAPLAPLSAIGPIGHRDEAYRALESVALFLEEYEPHSPVHLLIRRAVEWGRNPLTLLLQRLLSDPGLAHWLLEPSAEAGAKVIHGAKR
jgi:type VI secretion system protein ImpA